MAPVTGADVRSARERIESVVHRTPLDESTTFAARSGAAAVGLKLETHQRTGSFKIRGAYNRLAQFSAAERERGAVAASAGNHAQGVALAGDLLDIETTVVVPEGTPAAKIDATRGYGAAVIVHGATYEESVQRALELADEDGREFVHPFDDAQVIAGQGTVGLELREQFPDLDTVVVPVGGGGLIGGVATALQSFDPEVRVVGAQPTGAAHAKPSLERDEIVRLDAVDTVADGIADERLLETTFAIARERVDDVVAVTDREIAAAVALLAERAKAVAEPAGAAAVAAALSDDLDVADERVAVVVSGGNVDLTTHGELVRVGLRELGRYATVRLALTDWPTGLVPVVETLQSTGASVDDLRRAPRTRGDHPNRHPVSLAVEGSDRDHLHDVRAALAELPGVEVLDSDWPTA